jgi:hypothetical protein
MAVRTRKRFDDPDMGGVCSDVRGVVEMPDSPGRTSGVGHPRRVLGGIRCLLTAAGSVREDGAMTDDQKAALLFGPIAILWGALFVAARTSISEKARAQRARAGQHVGPRTQTPAQMAIGGVLTMVVGVAVVIWVLTSLLT